MVPMATVWNAPMKFYVNWGILAHVAVNSFQLVKFAERLRK